MYGDFGRAGQHDRCWVIGGLIIMSADRLFAATVIRTRFVITTGEEWVRLDITQYRIALVWFGAGDRCRCTTRAGAKSAPQDGVVGDHCVARKLGGPRARSTTSR